MRFLFTLQPGTGHLHPLVPLARRLQEGGHEVRLATAPSFVPDVEAAGLLGFGVGRDWLESEAATMLPGFLDAYMAGQNRAFVELAAQFADDLLLEDWRPHVVVRETVEFAGAVYAARLSIPCVVHGITVRPPLGLLNHWAGDPLRALLSRHGLHEDLGLLEQATYLNHMPPSWVPDGVPPLDGERFFAPATVGAPRDASGFAGLARRNGTRPLVYATLGTVFNASRPVFDRLIEAADGESFDLLLTIGRNGDPDAFEVPANVRVERYVQQELVLPHVAAVVCHGGMGTTMGALAQAVPVCCIPLAADQPVNAMRCVDLGCGRSYTTFTPDAVRIPHARPEDLDATIMREHIVALLEDPSYRAAAARIADEIAALPGIEEETRLLVEMAAASVDS